MVDSIQQQILAGAQQLELDLTSDQLTKLEAYIQLLVKWNRAYNLTAIRDPHQMVSYHLLDSLVLAHHFSERDRCILDVGSGAGLPGIPLSILFPDKHFTLLDSNGKKTRFIVQTTIELELPNCSAVNTRVENFSPEQGFDVVVSRAFASIRDFFVGAHHLLGEQGRLYAMKGKYPYRELEELAAGAQIVQVEKLLVPFLDEERHLVVLSKHRQELDK